MFNKNRKKEEVNNEFGDNGYQMKEKYNADELVVANLQRISSQVTSFGPMLETTKQKYIFEIVSNGEKISYREIFTGFISDDEEKYFNVPYVVNPRAFTDYFPKTLGIEIPKLSLIWIQNDINYPKEKKVEKQLKKK